MVALDSIEQLAPARSVAGYTSGGKGEARGRPRSKLFMASVDLAALLVAIGAIHVFNAAVFGGIDFSPVAASEPTAESRLISESGSAPVTVTHVATAEAAEPTAVFLFAEPFLLDAQFADGVGGPAPGRFTPTSDASSSAGPPAEEDIAVLPDSGEPVPAAPTPALLTYIPVVVSDSMREVRRSAQELVAGTVAGIDRVTEATAEPLNLLVAPELRPTIRDTANTTTAAAGNSVQAVASAPAPIVSSASEGVSATTQAASQGVATTVAATTSSASSTVSSVVTGASSTVSRVSGAVGGLLN